MKIFYLILILLFEIGCSHPSYNIDLTDKVTRATIKEIKSLYPVTVTGNGGAYLCGVRKLSLNVSIKKNLTIDESRMILVDCVERYLNNINDDVSIRPILIEFPFPASRITFNIFIHNEDSNQTRKPGNLIACCLSQGKISYESVKEECLRVSSNQVQILREETFAEAQRIVNEGKHA